VFNHDKVVKILTELGFTRQESDIYIALLKQSPLSGYKIAQILNKSASNIYKALETLEMKEAVLVEESSSNKQFAAVPIKEFLDNYEKSFSKKRGFLEESLKNLGKPAKGDQIYTLQTVEQVYTHIRKMLKRAEQIVLLDVFPEILEKILPDIEKTAERGVSVVLVAYQEIEIEGCNIIERYKYHPEMTLDFWKIDLASICVDSMEFLAAYISSKEEKVYHSVWSSSPFLANMIFTGMVHELMYQEYLVLNRGKEPSETMKKAKEKLYTKDMGPDIRGFKSIFERIGK